MQKKILILVDFLNFLRSDLYKCSTLNLDTVKSVLSKNGYEVEIKSFQDILNSKVKPKNYIIWYSSSDFISYKNYIEDILLYLQEDNILIPPFEMFRAHENKGYQEILRRKLDLPLLESHYFGTLSELHQIIDNIDFPLVLKHVEGSGSLKVQLIKNSNQLIKRVKKESKVKSFLINLSKNYLKRYVFTNRYSYDNSLESVYYKNYVLQKYIPGLVSDWKVLVFYDKYYVLERFPKRNDFRASGSGIFSYREFDFKLLDFCKDIFVKLNNPWAGFDVVKSEEKYHLLELQGIYLGPATLLNSPYYFIKQNDRWIKIEERSDLSTEYAESIVKYLTANSDS